MNCLSHRGSLAIKSEAEHTSNMAAAYEKDPAAKEVVDHHGAGSDIADEEVGVVHKAGNLQRDLKNRHMQSK